MVFSVYLRANEEKCKKEISVSQRLLFSETTEIKHGTSLQNKRISNLFFAKEGGME